MVLMVLDTEAIADGVLPMAQLAAQMRLPEGYDAVPGQDDRLRLRLKAAIGMIERRLGRILISREVILAGPGTGQPRMTLPVTPVTEILSVEVIRSRELEVVEGARLEEDVLSPSVILPVAASPGMPVRIRVRAGWSNWSAIPVPLAQAAFLVAEALDEGEGAAFSAMVERLIAPWRNIRIGGRS